VAELRLQSVSKRWLRGWDIPPLGIGLGRSCIFLLLLLLLLEILIFLVSLVDYRSAGIRSKDVAYKAP
jgi:hypothetical protein